MRVSRRFFLKASTAAQAGAVKRVPALDPVAVARRHSILRQLPTPSFFEGMLLGNGDVGVCVVLRPDALGLHLGKLDVWDIRVSEDHIQHVKPFQEFLKMWEEASRRARQEGDPQRIHLESSDPDLRAYVARVRSSYAKPWPRPWPCGTVWIHWDARWLHLIEQRLDISTGVYTAFLEHSDHRGSTRKHEISVFLSWDSGCVHVSCPSPAPVLSVAYYPHFEPQARMPEPELSVYTEGAGFGCRQILPVTPPMDETGTSPRSAGDREFMLWAALAGRWEPATPERRRRVLLKPAAGQPLRIDIALYTSLETQDPQARAQEEARRASGTSTGALRERCAAAWSNYWSRSGVELADPELERIWYHNQYFLGCCLREGKVAPGLFGNWSAGNVGTAWHGDYHMNYNTQQVFWGVFSSNHVDQHLPYVALVRSLMQMAEWNARVQFGLPGAYFPHSAYPVPSKVNPYPVPPWGYEICETPWTVQSLWWHYLYTQDRNYLAEVYDVLKAAATFLAAYVQKGEDGYYHIIPTVSPENWGLTVDYRLNRDCIIDLALTHFLFEAMITASEILDRDSAERPRWREILDHLAPFPEGEGPYGRVWIDVRDAPPEHVYNVPVTLSPVFPAERVGVGRGGELMEIARRTARTVRLEGGNDLVWQPLVRARLGMLDWEWFKKEVQYCLLPNGVANDRVRQIGGRYRDETNFDFMMRMGVWTENLSLPAVINECLMQSWTGVIRLFPNAAGLKAARFRNLRAVGAFLVSASWNGREVTFAEIVSEKGAEARVESPWRNAVVRSGAQTMRVRQEGSILVFPTAPGTSYQISPQ